MNAKDRGTANRRNSLKSTGPTTLEGKAASRMNAVGHGLTAETIILPDEHAEDFYAFAEDLRTDLGPVGALEAVLADRIVTAAWRLRRVLRVEAGVFAFGLHSPLNGLGILGGETTTLGLAFIRAGNNSADAFSKLCRYETALERGLTSALHELQRLQAARDGRDVAPPEVVDVTLNLAGIPNSAVD